MTKITDPTPDSVNHPSHYQGNGLEVIDVIEAFGMSFSAGNCLKYLLRAGKKSPNPREDYEKSLWYLNRLKNNEPEMEYPEQTALPIPATPDEALFQWCVQNRKFPVVVPGGYRLSGIRKGVMGTLTINTQGFDWGWSTAFGKKIESGALRTAADVTELLNRLNA